MTSPDPRLTANVYCSAHLDEVVHRVVAPLWKSVSADGRLWFMRYSRCGEHLKIRWHGDEATKPEVRRLLSERVSSYFASLGETTPAASRRSRPAAPPIDAEDAATRDYDDRSLLWTRYRRSPLALGARPFLDDAGYVALISACLTRGCEQVMMSLVPDSRGAVSHGLRQRALLESVILGLTALAPEKRVGYLRYHRDGLIRYAAVASGGGIDKARKIFHRYDLRARNTVSSHPALREAALGIPRGPSRKRTTPWESSLAELLEYVAPLTREANYHVDPFTDEPEFPVLFRVFHVYANQIGLDALNEGLAYHLLLCALTGRGGGGEDFRIIPV